MSASGTGCSPIAFRVQGTDGPAAMDGGSPHWRPEFCIVQGAARCEEPRVVEPRRGDRQAPICTAVPSHSLEDVSERRMSSLECSYAPCDADGVRVLLVV